MIDLNNSEFAEKEIKIFNGGVAGAVPNVSLRVEKRKIEEPETNPLFKVFFTDELGGEVNQAWWSFTPNSQKSDEQNKQLQGYYISRLLHLARAVMGKEYQFPAVESVDEALTLVMGLVNDNAGGSKFNIFVNYGTTRKPSQYLSVRYFNFIEKNVEGAKIGLTPTNSDVMERITEDQPDSNSESIVDQPVTDWTSLG